MKGMMLNEFLGAALLEAKASVDMVAALSAEDLDRVMLQHVVEANRVRELACGFLKLAIGRLRRMMKDVT